MTFQLSHLNKAIIFLTLCAACLLQVQMDFFATSSYAGLRFSAADLLVPVAGVLILMSLIKQESDWPIFKIRKLYIWIGAMSAALLVALYTGMRWQGDMPVWGLHNKIIGWFVLLAYFMWGTWVAHNVKFIKIYKFFRAFTIMALIVCTIGSVIITLQDLHFIKGLIAYPYKGLMANRNALGFLFLCTTIMVFFYGLSAKPLLSRWAEHFFWFILPLVYIQIGSRSCWIIGILQMIAFVAINRAYFFKKIVPSFALGCFVIFSLSTVHDAGSNFIFKQQQNVQFMELPGMLKHFSDTQKEEASKSTFKSDMLRVVVNGLAIKLWMEHPIQGIGLGTTQFEEPKAFGEFLDVIDSTPVFLLAETGIVGFMIFACFFGTVILTIILECRKAPVEIRIIDYVALGVFGTFAVMCVMHELMYTRFLWFILGLAITVPAKALRTRQACIDQETNSAPCLH